MYIVTDETAVQAAIAAASVRATPLAVGLCGTPAVIDACGRAHAPHDGWQDSDGWTYRGGEYVETRGEGRADRAVTVRAVTATGEPREWACNRAASAAAYAILREQTDAHRAAHRRESDAGTILYSDNAAIIGEVCDRCGAIGAELDRKHHSFLNAA